MVLYIYKVCSLDPFPHTPTTLTPSTPDFGHQRSSALSWIGRKHTRPSMTQAAHPAMLSALKNTSPNGWIVQKFGGTSVGKFPDKIAEDIVRYGPRCASFV